MYMRQSLVRRAFLILHTDEFSSRIHALQGAYCRNLGQSLTDLYM